MNTYKKLPLSILIASLGHGTQSKKTKETFH